MLQASTALGIEADRAGAVISGPRLFELYVTPAMQRYFRAKLPDLDEGELRARIEETLKFLAIADFCSGDIPVSREIDDIWHLWILQTKQYALLCQRLSASGYIDHSSNLYREDNDGKERPPGALALDVKMLATYVMNYGPFERDRVKHWLLAADLVEKRGWTMEALNAWLASA